ncbi:unnamed protein product [Miscanthus lutarioriparius]|uniref:Uncharacterized protein n=1 Tax=Miscanthus lutarioriparius TaxID=422564 RepID=A0A811PBS7_9POAL|nr:unnamed protein product [Miscanthus lutarioriparius]
MPSSPAAFYHPPSLPPAQENASPNRFRSCASVEWIKRRRPPCCPYTNEEATARRHSAWRQPEKGASVCPVTSLPSLPPRAYPVTQPHRATLLSVVSSPIQSRSALRSERVFITAESAVDTWTGGRVTGRALLHPTITGDLAFTSPAGDARARARTAQRDRARSWAGRTPGGSSARGSLSAATTVRDDAQFIRRTQALEMCSAA